MANRADLAYLFDFGFLCLFLFAGFDGLPIQRLGCKLSNVSVACHNSEGADPDLEIEESVFKA